MAIHGWYFGGCFRRRSRGLAVRRFDDAHDVGQDFGQVIVLGRIDGGNAELLEDMPGYYSADLLTNRCQVGQVGAAQSVHDIADQRNV